VEIGSLRPLYWARGAESGTLIFAVAENDMTVALEPWLRSAGWKLVKDVTFAVSNHTL
jgi:hypothetical protein